jgi:hypothetical protein
MRCAQGAATSCATRCRRNTEERYRRPRASFRSSAGVDASGQRTSSPPAGLRLKLFALAKRAAEKLRRQTWAFLGRLPQGGVDLGDDVVGEIDVVADENEQLAHGLDLPAGVVRFGLGLADPFEHHRVFCFH